jgi:hypothetical protein
VSNATVAADPSARIPLSALPWLPRPSAKMRDRLATLPAEPLPALLFVQSLAQAAWGEADLRLLLVRDHFSRLGFVQAGAQDGETAWRLVVVDYCEKALPLQVDRQRERKLASTDEAHR